VPSVTVLCGGFGAARFLSGLRRVDGVDLTCVVNTADDLVYEGLSVSPDLDTVAYALAGRFDEERGWGLVGDTFHNAEALQRFGSGWFGIGDADLATHLFRTNVLAGGGTLSEGTTRLAKAMGIAARILPMSDDPVRTIVDTPEGRLPFQEYLVKRRAAPPVLAVDHDGLAAAGPAPGVLEAIGDADLVVIAPSNPVASIGPILALPGVRAAIAARRAAAVAVTPVVSGQPPSTPPEQGRAKVRAAFMAARGLGHGATEVAAGYADLVARFVLDRRDSAESTAIEQLGLEILLADTLAPPRERAGLAKAVVEFGLH
jgi:LPPG:FO 2-phospho-L-lactate transferase